MKLREGHFLADGTHKRWPHVCPGDGCAIRAWIQQRAIRAQHFGLRGTLADDRPAIAVPAATAPGVAVPDVRLAQEKTSR